MGTKEKIIDVSIELFSNNGYNGVSIRDITKLVGIRESSLYKHFKSKEEILDNIFEIFIKSYNQTNLTEEEIQVKVTQTDLLPFLRIAIENFFRDMETPRLEKIFRILMNEQFRVEKARNIIINYLMHDPVSFYSAVFQEKLKDRFPDYNLLAREFHYPVFAMVYEYSVAKINNGQLSEIKKQILEHVDFYFNNILYDNQITNNQL